MAGRALDMRRPGRRSVPLTVESPRALGAPVCRRNTALHELGNGCEGLEHWAGGVDVLR